MPTVKLPRGIKNNNPGNIRWGSPWQGLVPTEERTDPSFCQFTTPAYGIRALARTLITYHDQRLSSNGTPIDTISEIVERWAPPSENDTLSYIASVVQHTGFDSEQVLDMHRYDHLRPVVEAIIRHECGRGPLDTVNSWYSEDAIDAGLRLAGVTKPVAEIAKMPATKETIGATATAGVGVAQIADVMPTVLEAAQRADSHISSGDWVRIVFGLATIATAAYIAYAQLRKHQEGALA